jgi:hypothetical protein
VYNGGMDTIEKIEKFSEGFRQIVLDSDEKLTTCNRNLLAQQNINRNLLRKLEASMSDEVTPREQALIEENERLITRNDILERQYYTLLQKLKPVDK